MKYKLKALSVQIGGKVHKIEDNTIFDIEKRFKSFKSEIEAAEKVGFLIQIKEKKKPVYKEEKKSKNK